MCVVFFVFLEDVPGGRFGRVSLMLRRRFMSPDPAAPEPDGAPPIPQVIYKDQTLHL